MASAWVKFRDSIVKAAKKVGKHETERAVTKKLTSQGYDPQEAQIAAKHLTGRAVNETGYTYDEQGNLVVDVNGRKLTPPDQYGYGNSYGSYGGSVSPMLIVGLGLGAFLLLRGRK